MKTKMFAIIFAALVVANSNAQSVSNLPDYLTAYMQMKDALHVGDIAKTKNAAVEMKSAITSKDVADEKKLEAINTVLASISSADDLEVQRTAFAKLTQYLIPVVEDHPVKGVVIYSDFCHMARDGKGAYWLSTDKEINNNPYMGTMMPHCGEVDEKISN
jgi:lipoate synthase